MRIDSWNIHRRVEPWYCLLELEVDIALLQEAAEPPPKAAGQVKAS